MTLRGILPYRLACAASLIIAGAVLLVDALMAQASDGRSWFTLLELGLVVLLLSLSARSLGSRIEIDEREVKLHSTWRTVRLDLAEVEGVTHGRFLGWDVLRLGLRGSRSARLPLLTQPGDPDRLHRLEKTLKTELAKRRGQSPTTSP